MNSVMDFIDPVNQSHFTGQFSVMINNCFTECTRKAAAKNYIIYQEVKMI